MARRTITLRLHRHVAASAGRDAHGNPLSTYSVENYTAYAVAPRVNTEPDTGRTVVLSGYTVFAPSSSSVPSAHDRLQLTANGDLYELDGDSADWTRGAYGKPGGVAFDIKRVEG